MAFYRLNVSFEDKEKAKAFGAKWFAAGKYWYYDGEVLPEGLKRWYTVSEKTKTGIDISEKTSGVKKISENGKADEVIFDADDHYAKYKTVSEVNDMISEIVYATNEFRNILVKGEITNFDGHRGKHYYFAIKDENALLPCVLWEGTALSVLKFKLEKGQQVAIAGNLEYYKEGGKAQLIVSNIENIGDGKANLALMKLKAKLQNEGLFDEIHKKEIPKHPETVGILTSKSGQAIKDICKVAKKRNPYVQLVLYHVNVQGINAVSTITKGIKELDALGMDSIIIGRGGGSDEELMAYNDEKIARAVFEAVTPIVSAVGHEGHWTLIDYVADKRCATPSEAAEETIPDVMVDVKRLGYLVKSISDNMLSRLNEKRLQLENVNARIMQKNPERIFKEKSDRLESLQKMIGLNFKSLFEAKKDIPDQLLQSMKNNIRQAFELRVHRFEVLLTKMNGLSPSAKLINGFGYITKEDRPLSDIEMAGIGDKIDIRIHNGLLKAEITEINRIDE
ncbi:MAG: exodeoxyribonuclease VII large subunit [Lachnospiraceae bacterium]|nr:exodeoxyribonuclease VII large subunit [Lachnospiraceae bacterium]